MDLLDIIKQRTILGGKIDMVCEHLTADGSVELTIAQEDGLAYIVREVHIQKWDNSDNATYYGFQAKVDSEANVYGDSTQQIHHTHTEPIMALVKNKFEVEIDFPADQGLTATGVTVFIRYDTYPEDKLIRLSSLS